MKKIILTAIFCLFTFICTSVIAFDIFVKLDTEFKSMEFTLPLFAKREITKLSEETFFDEEKLEKINLSKGQAKRILNKVERSSNWVHGELDELVNERLSFYTREEIYNKIPHIENMYWIFTNRSNGLKDRHSIEETINERCYYSISFAAFDVESRVLYYYTFSR